MNLLKIKNRIANLKEMAEEMQDDQIQKIIKAVCCYFTTTENELKQKVRVATKCYPRQIMCYLVYQYTLMGHRRIAKRLNQHHTTVLAGMRKIKGFIDIGDEQVINDLKFITYNIKRPVHVKKTNPLEYRDSKGQRRFRVAPELKKKPGPKPNSKVNLKIVRPAAEYSNTGHLKLISEYSKEVAI